VSILLAEQNARAALQIASHGYARNHSRDRRPMRQYRAMTRRRDYLDAPGKQ
jgi:ABC-type branched-subunit amino acid transport system ATPase component